MNMDPLQITFTKLVCYTVKTLPNGIFTILELDSYYPHTWCEDWNYKSYRQVSKNALSNSRTELSEETKFEDELLF